MELEAARPTARRGHRRGHHDSAQPRIVAAAYHRPDAPTSATIRQAPKALLHDHLDGGLRPATVVDLAAEYGYDGLPTTDLDELAALDPPRRRPQGLELYLETFAHTVGVMQERDAIVRVAAECAEDLAADGVVYAEVRYRARAVAPSGA